MSKLMLIAPHIPGKEKIMRGIARTGLKVAKVSPELCLAGGIVAGVGATVLACMATLRISDTLTTYHDNLDKMHFIRDKINKGENLGVEYSIEDEQRDKFINFVQASVAVGKLFLPAIALGTLSVALFLGGHHIMIRRQAALMVGYQTLQAAYSEYRRRVAAEVGEEKELDIFHGVQSKVEEIVDEKGRKKKVTTHTIGQPASPYTRIFDEGSRWWEPNAEANKFFLCRMEQHANDILRINGHLFLNEVFDMLDLPRTRMGAMCGWIADAHKDGNGDGFVSFGMWDASKQGVREFINGVERNIWLDFNCDGVIYDLIEREKAWMGDSQREFLRHSIG